MRQLLQHCWHRCALAGDIGSYGYGAGGYEDYEDYAPYQHYAPVIRKEIIVERPVVIEKRVVVERPVILEERRYVVEIPLKYRHGPRYSKRYHRKHLSEHPENRGYGKHFDHRLYGQY